MICVHCGKQLPPGSDKCACCGAETEEDRLDYQPGPAPVIRLPEEKPPEENPVGQRPVIAIEDEDDVVPVYAEQPEPGTIRKKRGGSTVHRKMKEAWKALTRMLSSVMVLLLLAGVLTPRAFAAQAVQDARKSVVRVVQVLYANNEPFAPLSWGTGVYVGDAADPSSLCVVTNRHVVEEDPETMMEYRLLYPLDSFSIHLYIVVDQTVSCDIELNSRSVTLSRTADLALIRTGVIYNRVVASFPESGSVEVTQTVYAIGFPGIAEVADTYSGFTSDPHTQLARALPSRVSDMTVTQGTVTKADFRVDNVQTIQHGADISTGNSGGPLVDEKGRVVGINTWMNTDASVASKTQYAIDVREVKSFLSSNNVAWQTKKSGGGIPTWVWVAGAAVVVILIFSSTKTPAKPTPVPNPPPRPATAPPEPKPPSDGGMSYGETPAVGEKPSVSVNMGKKKSTVRPGESALFSVASDFGEDTPPGTSAETPKTPPETPAEYKSGFTDVTDFDT